MPHKLLLADDSVTIQRVIELTFADEDIQVVAVGDGQQAIARIEADRPDIVLADVGMPEKDGYEVAQYIKNHAHLKHIPVVLLTGAFEPIDDARAHAIGCDGVLVKPFEPQMVISRVKDLLSGRRSSSAWATPPEPSVRPAGRGAQEATGGAKHDYKELDMESADKGPAPPQAESLDEYFDRLDAAFAGLAEEPAAAAQARPPAAEPAPEPPPAFDRHEAPAPAPRDGTFSSTLDQWDPSLSEETPVAAATPPAATPPAPAAPPAPLPPAAPAPAPPVAAAPAPAPAPAVAPSLSDAFAALLAAEQAQIASPAAPVPATPTLVAAAPVGDEVIEAIVERVIQRMTTSAVRDTVLQVAERLVREEIARIKNTTR
jgi:CheY-like chemotaxis protein